MSKDKKIQKDRFQMLRHDANNQLSIIIGFTQLLEMNLNKESKEYLWVKKILNETKKLKDSISKIKE